MCQAINRAGRIPFLLFVDDFLDATENRLFCGYSSLRQRVSSIYPTTIRILFPHSCLAALWVAYMKFGFLLWESAKMFVL